jgi:diguanylate cyclase (GGDEF)-like protein
MSRTLIRPFGGSIKWMMATNGTWLCPTEQDRARLLDMEARIARPRALMYAAVGAAFASVVPWIGWWTAVPLLVQVALYAVLRPRIATSQRPEYIVFATVFSSQVLLGVGIALSGGPQSPAIALLLLPLITLPARFSGRGVWAGLGITVVVLLVTGIAIDPAAYAHDPTYVNAGLCAVVGLTVFAQFLMSSEMQQRSASILDPLTGLLNRTSLHVRFDEIAEQAAQTGDSVCVLVCDLDRFKAVNDRYGHERGDDVLKEAALVLRKQLRAFELVYRLGGEEFLVVLPGTTLAEGRDVAQRARAALAGARPGDLPVTISIGVAAARGEEVTYESLFRAADAALYEAKRSGRDRVVAFGDESDVRLAGAQARRRAA